MTAQRNLIRESFMNAAHLNCGLTWQMVEGGLKFVYQTLDALDTTLLDSGLTRITGVIELANLSSVIGNLLATGIVNASNGVFSRAGPHKYQDLRATDLVPEARNIEIKISLETNKPKAHLPKEGPHLTCRYVLGDADGHCVPGQRGDVVWIWEVRFGHLQEHHYTVSNTAGDSGKTAVVNADGMTILRPIYFDPTRCPMSRNGRVYRALLSELKENRLGDRSSQ